VLVLRATLCLGIGLGLTLPASAQRQCEWDGERTICTTTPTGPPRGRDFILDLPPPPDPAAEKLAANLRAYEGAALQVSRGTRLADSHLGRPAPTTEAELSQRIDTILELVWPEFSARAIEAERLRQQGRFYEVQSKQLQTAIQQMRERAEAVERWIKQKSPELANLERHTAEARQLEARLTSMALAQINDRTSERRAIATILAFAPNPRITPERLTPPAPIELLPGTRLPPLPDALVADQASAPLPAVPEEFELKLSRPPPGAPVEDKLAALWTVGVALQYDEDDVGVFRSLVPERRSQYEVLLTEQSILRATLMPLEARGKAIESSLVSLNGEFRTAAANHHTANTAIVTEIVADMALDQLAAEMRAIVDDVAGSEGLEATVPSSRGQALLDFVRRGGRAFLPVRGYEKQWEAFVDIQEQTLGVLDRAQGFMSEAVQVLSRGSAADAEALLGRVFASLQWQEASYIRTAGFSALPDEEGKPMLLDIMDRLVEKKRAQEADRE
jgi:hypothetical protein